MQHIHHTEKRGTSVADIIGMSLREREKLLTSYQRKPPQKGTR